MQNSMLIPSPKKEQPVRLSGFDVRGLRAGTQLMLRAEVRFLGYPRTNPPANILSATALDGGRWLFTDQPDGGGNFAYARCPYGVVGQRLWGQELWHRSSGDPEMGETSYWCYKADTEAAFPDGWDELPKEDRPAYAYWKGSSRMPREASRLLLEVTALRCERVQAISESDAIAQGIEWYADAADFGKDAGWQCYPKPGPGLVGMSCNDPRYAYETLFRHLHGPQAWTDNRWVWVANVAVVGQPVPVGAGAEAVGIERGIAAVI